MDRRELLKTVALGSVIASAGGAIETFSPAWAQNLQRTAPRAGTPRVTFVRASLANGIIVHAGGTALDLYHTHPHNPQEEALQPDDIRQQTRLCLRNHKEILDWMGLGWRNVVKLRRYQTRMSESQEIEKVMAEYFKDWWPAMIAVPVRRLSSPQARLEIDMWVVPNAAGVVAR